MPNPIRDEGGAPVATRPAPPPRKPTPPSPPPIFGSPDRQVEQRTPAPPAAPDFIGPMAPKPIEPDKSLELGRPRFERLLANAPAFTGSAASHDWDQWVLNIKDDPKDREFSLLLRDAKMGATRRERERGNTVTGPEDIEGTAAWSGKRATERKLVEAGDTKKRKAAEAAGKRIPNVIPKDIEGEPVVIGLDGKPVVTPTASIKGAGGQAVAQAPPSGTELETGKSVRDGTHVYIGQQAPTVLGVRGARGAKGDPLIGQTRLQTHSAYMSADNAATWPATWDPKDIAAFQHMFHLKETGIYDQTTYNKWNAVVKAGARYTAAGKKIGLTQLAVMIAGNPKKKGGGHGGGGGGGGGGGRGGAGGYKASEVKAFLNQIMQKEAGREATDAEAKAFLVALNAAGEVDPTQYATDWVRGHVGGEAGAYSAVNYYEVMKQALGG